MSNKSSFSSKIGMIAATVGSAIGLGNIWRFPAETQANGGAAFLAVYVLCVFILGIPVMLGEFALGKGGGSDNVGIYKKLSPGTPWWLIGTIGLLASYIILTFYVVVAGWTLEYLVSSVDGSLYGSLDDSGSLSQTFASRMNHYVASPVSPVIYTYIIIAINLAILLFGVRKGIERVSNVMMPVLFAVLIIFIIVALQLPRASEGLEFFLSPDFSKITPGVIINALGQAFFSLSLGMGILTTFAAYFPKNTNLTRTAITVSLLDLLVAVMMGFIIFPAITSFGLTNETFAGATLVFVTLPEVFAQMNNTVIWSSLFFLLLLFAAITSTISIAEVSIAFCIDRFGMRRRNACLVVMLPLLVLSAASSLSLIPEMNLTIMGKSIFDFSDTVTTNFLLPFAALMMCIYLGWFAPNGFLKRELTSNSNIGRIFFPAIYIIIRYIAPVAILLIFVWGLI